MAMARGVHGRAALASKGLSFETEESSIEAPMISDHFRPTARRGIRLLPRSIAWSGVRVANRCISRAMTPVQPAWWLARRPAPLSPWK